MNICKFVPAETTPDVITTMNFVTENGDSVYRGPFIFSFFRICLITKGNCVLKFNYGRHSLEKNDVFVLFPSVEYSLECSPDFSFMYISYFGIRVNAIHERLKISKTSFVFKDMPHVRPYWEQEFSCAGQVLDLASESVLLYTYSEIGSRLTKNADGARNRNKESMLYVKKYIDENFCSPSLDLEDLSVRFKYNKKYLSHQFKKTFGSGINEYVNTLRIAYACALIEQKHLFVREIAFMCGYKDPLYFSRVFKRLTGSSPKDLIKKR